MSFEKNSELISKNVGGLTLQKVALTRKEKVGWEGYSHCAFREESSYWITEDQAFSSSYDLAPPPFPPHSPVSKLDRR